MLGPSKPSSKGSGALEENDMEALCQEIGEFDLHVLVGLPPSNRSGRIHIYIS